MEEVPRCTSLVPLAFPCFLHCLIGVETEGLLDYQGRAGDHFHCTVEPSPGHIRCRESIKVTQSGWHPVNHSAHIPYRTIESLDCDLSETLDSHFEKFPAFSPRALSAGLAIYVARGLWSGSAEITAVAFTACGGWRVSSKNEMQKLDIFQVVSTLVCAWWRKPVAEEEPKHAEIQIARAERRQLC